MNQMLTMCFAAVLMLAPGWVSATQRSSKAAIPTDQEQEGQRPAKEADAQQAPEGVSAVEQEWRDAADAWRQADADAQASALGDSACSPEIERWLNDASDSAKTMLELKRAYYGRILEWYGKRYQSASNLMVDYQPQIAVLERQLDALRAERSDLQRRSRALRGDRTEAAKATLDELIDHKAEQVGNIEEALTEFEGAKGNVQQERRVAADARAKIVEILRTVQSEQDLFEAYYRNQRSSANLRCTKSEPILRNLSVKPRGKGGI